MRLDTYMTETEQTIEIYEQRIGDLDTDAWDRVDLEQELPNLHYRWGQACTQLAIEMNSVIYHGQRLIDDWRELLLSKIGRRYSQFDRMYLRAERAWPAVAAHPVWMRLRLEGVPF